MQIDPSNPDTFGYAISEIYTELRHLRADLRKINLPDTDVRLISDSEGNLWIASGDVSYDTEHGAACEAGSILVDSSDQDLLSLAGDLVEIVADQLIECRS